MSAPTTIERVRRHLVQLKLAVALERLDETAAGLSAGNSGFSCGVLAS